MEMTATKAEVTFQNLTYSVKVGSGRNGKTKDILRDVSGAFQPGRFTAVLGASGAGKTTLLNILSGRSMDGKMTGAVLINGQKASSAIMRKISGFVFQDDVIMESMTVREALVMSARLRLPRRMSHKEKMARVEEVIEDMHLEKCADTNIGSSLVKGVSGGERKRCALGMEMIRQPAILYCDEPTSGLDAFTAYHVVQVLKGLARRGRTIIATLHQPSSEIFHMFDDLLLMSEGKIMYFGRAEQAIDYFALRGYPCPHYTNPADYFFMKILNTLPSNSAKNTGDVESTDMEKGVKREEASERINRLLLEWPESELGLNLQKQVNKPTDSTGVNIDDIEKTSTLPTQFSVLMNRAMKNAVRNKLVAQARLGQTIAVALIVGLIYLNVTSGQIGIQNRNGALFFVAVNNFMAATMGVLTVFGAEKAVFAREYVAGMYGATAFYFSKVVVELPLQIVFPVVFSAISYFMVGFQRTAEKFFIYTTAVILVTNCGSALGITIAAACSELSVALAITPLLMLPLMVFSGFFVNNGGIPPYFDWIKWLSPMKYGFSATVKNEYTGLVLNCTPQQISTDQCTTLGENVIAQLNLTNDPSIGVSLIIMVGLYVFLVLLGYVSLLRIVRRRHAN